MEFDLSSLLIGIVIGAVVAFLLKLKSLKSLQLNLEKIGVSLGVEGFDANSSKAGGGVSIGEISGQTGDIANTIDKSTRYGPKNTLQSTIENLTQHVKESGRYVGSYEQQSRLYSYHYKGDIDRIHNDLQQLLIDGWFVSSSLMLPDYEGTQRIWLVLTRPSTNVEGNKPQIHYEENKM